MRERDKIKMFFIIEETGIDIRIIESLKEIQMLSSIEEILCLPSFTENIKKKKLIIQNVKTFGGVPELAAGN